MNKTIKKIAALGVAVAMTAVTFNAALAATDLNEYPMPFVEDGVFMGKIVIGEKAAAIDTVGALDIAASLQRQAVSAATGDTNVVTSSSGKVEDVLLGTSLAAATAFGTTLDDTDLPFLEDSTVTFDIGGESEDYDYHEEIRFNSSVSTPATVQTGLAFTSPSEDWEEKVFIPFGTGSVGYYLVFDETLQQDLLFVNASSDDPITLNFLGKDLKITSATATSITAQVGNEYTMGVGDTVTFNGKTVKLVNVASSGSTAVIEVDGQRESVSGTETVNGVRIKVDDVFYSDTLAERQATLIIGSETTKTYSDGDEYIGEDEDNPAWVWDISGLSGTSPTLGVLFDLNLDNDDETDNPAYEHPLYEGDAIAFPNNFAEVKFDSLNQDEYVTYEFNDDTRDLYDATGTTALHTSARVIKGSVSGLSNSGFLVGSSKADTIYLYANDTTSNTNTTMAVFYKDSSSSKALFGQYVATGNTVFSLDYGKNTAAVSWNMLPVTNATSVGTLQNANLTFTFASGDTLITKLETSAQNALTYIGDTDDDTDGALWSNNTAIASWEENTRTKSGVVIYDPDSVFQKSSGTLKFDVPKDMSDFRANVVVQGAGSQTSSSSASGAVTLNPISVGLAILDSDATLGSKPYIVVGGPCANTVAAELMGNPEVCWEGFTEGSAMIKLYGSKNAILVAGYSGADTQGASRVLANFEDYDLSGTEVEVVTANLDSLSVKKVSS